MGTETTTQSEIMDCGRTESAKMRGDKNITEQDNIVQFVVIATVFVLFALSVAAKGY